MPFSHHSHSGQYCNHAKDQLEDVIQEAISQKMQVLALTEHMPRNQVEDLYPGESETGWDLDGQARNFDEYYSEARRLQSKYDGQIHILVGTEIDWIRASSKDWVEHLLSRYPLDIFVGSVHHVHGIPIDFSTDAYAKALAVASARTSETTASAETKLFMDYFDDQREMLTALRPPVVGHFDLIRLLSLDPNHDLSANPTIWDKIERNLNIIKDYGGVLELNSSGLRKGLKEPYPKLEVCKKFLELGGSFVFSDDSHGLQQVGHSYLRLLKHAEKAGVTRIVAFRRGLPTKDFRFPNVGAQEISLGEIRGYGFWNNRST